MLPARSLALPSSEQPRRLSIPAASTVSASSVYVAPLLVAATATLMAIWLYSAFWPVADQLWYSSTHDRNSHLWFGISLAIDFRTLDIAHFLKDLHGARIWGPLHPLVLGLVLAIGGLDERLAVLPSLACWVGCAVFAFLIARRMVAGGGRPTTNQGGNLAGAVAALFVLASPAYRAFATDIMLESMGACLSLGVLYFYLCTCQDRTARAAAGLGLMLTLLFFDKYNYWFLMLLALAANHVFQQPFETSATALTYLGEINWKRWSGAQLRHPVTWILIVLSAVLAFTLINPADYQVGSVRLSTRSPHNLVSVIVILLFVRLLPWWWRQGRARVSRLGVPGRQLVYWHVWPVVLWFLWPQRLSNCLAYLIRNHGEGEAGRAAFLGGLPYYWNCLGDHYHAAAWLPWLVLALAGVALFGHRRLRPGSSLVFWFLLVAGALTMSHPTLRSRFLHSWLATMWPLAGAGTALLLDACWAALIQVGAGLKRNPNALAGSVPRQVIAVAATALLAWFQIDGLRQLGRSPEGGPRMGQITVLDTTNPGSPQPGYSVDPVLLDVDSRQREALSLKSGRDFCQPQVLDLIMPYLPHLDNAHHPVVLSNSPLKFLAAWTYLKRHGRHGMLETDIQGFQPGGEKNEQVFQDWLSTTRCDALIHIRLTPGNYFHECASFTTYDALPQYLANQKVFQPAKCWHYPQYGGATVTLWKRARS